MKNLKKNILVILAIVSFLFLSFAIELVPSSAKVLENGIRKNTEQKGLQPIETYFMQNGNTYGRIAIVDIPQAIRSAVLSKYVAYSIDDVFQDKADSYKLILKNGKNKLVVYYSEDGVFLKHEKVKVAEMVALIQ